jgi:hypothetical protein
VLSERGLPPPALLRKAKPGGHGPAQARGEVSEGGQEPPSE